jgi:hypothetical protein
MVPFESLVDHRATWMQTTGRLLLEVDLCRLAWLRLTAQDRPRRPGSSSGRPLI